jgi:hypothetical protein
VRKIEFLYDNGARETWLVSVAEAERVRRACLNAWARPRRGTVPSARYLSITDENSYLNAINLRHVVQFRELPLAAEGAVPASWWTRAGRWLSGR